MYNIIMYILICIYILLCILFFKEDSKHKLLLFIIPLLFFKVIHDTCMLIFTICQRKNLSLISSIVYCSQYLQYLIWNEMYCRILNLGLEK